jgi:hypothetical protein
MTDLAKKAKEFADTRMTDILDWDEIDIVEAMAGFAERIRSEDRARVFDELFSLIGHRRFLPLELTAWFEKEFAKELEAQNG